MTMKKLPGNLHTFKILFLVQGILTLLFSLFFLFYAIMGSALSGVFNEQQSISGRNDMPFNPANIIIMIGIIGFIITVTIGSLTIVASQRMQQLRSYTFIFVMSIVNCLTGLLGILLCIFTLIEISKPHVKGKFEGLEHYDEDDVLDPA